MQLVENHKGIECFNCGISFVIEILQKSNSNGRKSYSLKSKTKIRLINQILPLKSHKSYDTEFKIF